jgi:hypothetical protein
MSKLDSEAIMKINGLNLMQRLHAQDPLLEIEDADGNRLLAEADGPIGLQACRMEFQDGSLFGRSGKVVFEAGMPWWQRPTQ